MQQYLDLLRRIRETGKRHANRTSQDTFRVWGAEVRHDLSQGFPLLTTKKMAMKSAFVELLGFVRGETDVRWYQDRGCNIWNADWERWHGPDLERDISRLRELPDPFQTAGIRLDDDNAPERKRLMESISHRGNNPHSLGRIYGAQWRDMNGYDQLGGIVKELRARSNSRRLIMSAWNPSEFHMMCLPPCHVMYHFMLDGDKLSISCSQRSADTPLGVPYNLANTALLCHLVANATGLVPGEMVWYGNDVHIYENQLPGVDEQLTREPRPLPTLSFVDSAVGKDPWEIEYSDLVITGYDPHPKIKYPLTVS